MFDAAVQLHRADRLGEAEALYRKILSIDPRHADALNLLGAMAGQMGQFQQAIELMKQAIEIQPKSALFHSNLGEAYRRLADFDRAIAAFRRAIELDRDFAHAHYNLGVTLGSVAEIEEAIECFDRAIKLEPTHPLAMAPERLFALNYHPGYDPVMIRREHEKWDRAAMAGMKTLIRPHENERSPERRLRIGYVSPDFRDHVVGWNVLPLLENHDHANFHITCYSTAAKTDEVSDRFRRCTDRWRFVPATNDDELAAMIRDEKIDILVDLALHTMGNRLMVFARKPAPVQVTFAGYPGTTGLSTMDYRLTDPYLDPPDEHDEFYTERSVRLPHSFWCYLPAHPELEVTALPAQTAGQITFGCLNGLVKISTASWAMWRDVMAQVPSAKFLTIAPSAEYRRKTCEKLGVGPERVEFVERLPRKPYLELYQRMDIALDTFPYNGHTTSLDSLWMGVPVVTLCGKSSFSRGVQPGEQFADDGIGGRNARAACANRGGIGGRFAAAGGDEKDASAADGGVAADGCEGICAGD